MTEQQTGRSVVVHKTRNEKGKPLFMDNAITTTKYTFWNFLPKNLFEQFRRIANFYFLLISIILYVFPWAPLEAGPAIVPLVIVVSISAIREAWEDIKRGFSDKKINNSTAHVLRGFQFVEVKWKDILVGDVIYMTKNEQVPADIVMLATSEPDGLAYIDTCNLDGETNLKVRQAMPHTKHVVDAAAAANFMTTIVCDEPNNLLYTFNGFFEFQGQTIPLENKQVLLRGCILRNTGWMIGVVVYTGLESKLMMNSSAARSKVSSLERGLNMKLISVFALMIGIGIVSGIIGCIYEKDVVNGKIWYIYKGWDFKRPAIAGFFILLIAYIILINAMIPISLYVTLEVVRLFQAGFVAWDAEMYHVETKTGADSRTSNLSEDLGNVEYIFSDKTGTLTRNIMEFMKCSIAGRKYGHGTTEVAYAACKRRGIPCEKPDPTGKAFKDEAFMQLLSGNTPMEIKHFLWMLSVCHAVIPEPDEKKKYGIAFQASSPDEGALVLAAADFGYLFKARTPVTVTVRHNDVDIVVEVLAVLEFTSERKRSSVIIKHPETGEIVLYCKGADDLIMARLAKNSHYVDVTQQHLKDFAADGLRTLCAAYKVLDPTWFDGWAKRYNDACCKLEGREQAIDEVANEVECDLNLLGATAIEDKLQIGVPEAIDSLLKAGIKVWVITGDKRETAINIGFACSLLSTEMKLVILDTNDVNEIRAELERGMQEQGQVALVASGTSLNHALDPEKGLKELFFQFSQRCQSVVCCRVSPKQKANVVEMVRDLTGALTLAIGDGANDVGMILKADIGVGISGQEGMQAVLASDYSFAQFRFLKRLLLVHGRLNFKRNVDLINYSFYKNMCCSLCQFLFGFFCDFSSLTLYDSMLISIFNVIFTSAPPVVYAGLERDVSINTCMREPELYKWDGKRKEMVSYWKYWEALFIGVLHALCCFFIPYFGMRPFVDASGKSLGYGAFGITVYGCVIFVVNFKIATMSSYWTWMEHFFIWGSAIIYPLVVIVLDYMGVATEIRGLSVPTFGSSLFWFSVVGATVLATIPIIAINAWWNSRDTQLNRILVRERTHIFTHEVRQEKPEEKPIIQETIEPPKPVEPEEEIIVPVSQPEEVKIGLYPDTENPTGYAFEPPVVSFDTVRYDTINTDTTNYGTAAQLRSRIRKSQVSTFGLDQL